MTPEMPPTFTFGEDAGVLQDLLDATFRNRKHATARDLSRQADIMDIDGDVLEVVDLMPPGSYTKSRMADQLNSIVTAHGWEQRLGTVE